MKDLASKSRPIKTVKSKKQGKPRRVIRLGELITREEIITEMGIAPATVSQWLRSGLQPLATDTKEFWFLTDDLVAFWKSQAKSEVDE